MIRKRKLGLRLQITGGRNKFRSNNPDWWGEVNLTKCGKVIGVASFTVTDTEICIDTFNVNHQRLGHGSLIMDAIKGIALFLRIPITLYSVINAVPFYEKMDFIFALKVRKKLDIIGEEPEERDMIWIPECIMKRKKIRVRI